MTDPKPPRAPRNSTPLTADQIVKKVRAIYATQARRIIELKGEDELEASKLLGRAQDEDEHAAARAMLSAVGIVITVIDAEYEDPAVDEPTVDDVPSAHVTNVADALDALPKGAAPYVPGPAARSAGGGR